MLLLGEPEATECESICAMLSDNARAQEKTKQCLLSVDMFTGEHAPLMKALHWLHQQCKHTVGMHVTQNCQVTDLRFSKLGKDAQTTCRECEIGKVGKMEGGGCSLCPSGMTTAAAGAEHCVCRKESLSVPE